MYEESHREFHMPLPFYLVIRDRDDDLKRLLLGRTLDCAIVLAIDHQHDAVTQLLRIGLRSTGIESLEKIEFGLIVAQPFKYFYPEPRPPDRQLMALVDPILLVAWNSENKFGLFPHGIVEGRKVFRGLRIDGGANPPSGLLSLP